METVTEYIRICPTCRAENAPEVMRCACGALLAGIDVVRREPDHVVPADAGTQRLDPADVVPAEAGTQWLGANDPGFPLSRERRK
jgi:hypothetical protein